ncbi:hypothetical protein [Turicibacter sanguinis]|nr:hypothetical protein [Turicibacter sanguinis]
MMNFKNMMLTIRNEYHEYKNEYGKITLKNRELNEMLQDNYNLGYTCACNQYHQQLTNEIEYAQKLLESNNDLEQQIELLEDAYDNCLDELERWKSIVKTIAPEMIDEE